MTNVEKIGDQMNGTTLFNLDWSIPEFLIPCFSEAKICLPFGLCCLSALLLSVAFFLPLYKRYVARSTNARDSAACILYCFLGNVSGTIGAVLSGQLVIQVLMGVFMTFLDFLDFIFIILPICLCRQYNNARRMEMMLRKRHRQNVLFVSIPMVLGASFFLCSDLRHKPVDRAYSNRHLLEVIPQDSGYIVGYTLGLLSLVIGWTSKFPVLIEAHRGEVGSSLEIAYGVLCVAAGLLYASAVLLYDIHLEAVLKALPWLLTSVGCAFFDIIIILLSCYRHRTTWQPPGPCGKRSSVETLSLLSSSALSYTKGSNPIPLKDLRSKKKPSNRTDVGDYIDVKIQSPVPQDSLKGVQISKEGQVGAQTLRITKFVRVDSFCTSESSTDTSSVNSDLEWDFEDVNSQWENVENLLKDSEAFPHQKWSTLSSSRPDSGCVGQGTKEPCCGSGGDHDQAAQNGSE